MSHKTQTIRIRAIIYNENRKQSARTKDKPNPEVNEVLHQHTVPNCDVE